VIVHQSDLASYNRCGEQHRRQLNGSQGKQLSATSYGSVMHHALHTLERTRDLDLALNTFVHYWHPLNIDAICPPVEEWIGRQSYGGLQKQGTELLKRYWDLKQYDDVEEVLALEIPFVVPVGDDLFAGTIDRLAVRKVRGRLTLCIDDWKSGRKKTYLKHNLQHVAYSWATTRPEFWLGNPEQYTEGFGEQGQALFDRFAGVPRQGFWIDVSGTTPKWNDCGVKERRDYARFLYAFDHYTRARRAEIFPLALEGEVCEYCPFRDTCPEGL
jgi:hypothetical protein